MVPVQTGTIDVLEAYIREYSDRYCFLQVAWACIQTPELHVGVKQGPVPLTEMRSQIMEGLVMYVQVWCQFGQEYTLAGTPAHAA